MGALNRLKALFCRHW